MTSNLSPLDGQKISTNTGNKPPKQTHEETSHEDEVTDSISHGELHIETESPSTMQEHVSPRQIPANQSKTPLSEDNIHKMAESVKEEEFWNLLGSSTEPDLFAAAESEPNIERDRRELNEFLDNISNFPGTVTERLQHSEKEFNEVFGEAMLTSQTEKKETFSPKTDELSKLLENMGKSSGEMEKKKQIWEEEFNEVFGDAVHLAETKNKEGLEKELDQLFKEIQEECESLKGDIQIFTEEKTKESGKKIIQETQQLAQDCIEVLKNDHSHTVPQKKSLFEKIMKFSNKVANYVGTIRKSQRNETAAEPTIASKSRSQSFSNFIEKKDEILKSTIEHRKEITELNENLKDAKKMYKKTVQKFDTIENVLSEKPSILKRRLKEDNELFFLIKEEGIWGKLYDPEKGVISDEDIVKLYQSVKQSNIDKKRELLEVILNEELKIEELKAQSSETDENFIAYERVRKELPPLGTQRINQEDMHKSIAFLENRLAKNPKDKYLEELLSHYKELESKMFPGV
jgi:hypothetical protein